jgi:hypothetical protein
MTYARCGRALSKVYCAGVHVGAVKHAAGSAKLPRAAAVAKKQADANCVKISISAHKASACKHEHVARGETALVESKRHLLA